MISRHDIYLLENDSTQAQQQLDALEHEAKIVGLEINIQKTEQMRLNQSPNSPTNPMKHNFSCQFKEEPNEIRKKNHFL